MKNLINYFYGMIVNDFKKIQEKFVFEINDYKYEFIPFDGDINLLSRVYSFLIVNKRYCHEIIKNKDNSIITYYQEKIYILIKKNFYSDRLLGFEDILYYDIEIYDSYKLNWKDLWKNKLDYYEYQINQMGFKYKILKDSFSYYVGLSECAISILNYVNEKDVNSYICHKRIRYKESLDDFLNPVNIIFDNRTRDVAEYIKINYINTLSLDFNEIINYINELNLNYDESLLLLARLLYPSYYFDIYDEIIQGKIKEEKIEEYIKKNISYEIFIKKVYKYIRLKYNIPEIEWLER